MDREYVYIVSSDVIEIYVKLAYTCKSINYMIEFNSTVTQMIDYIKSRVRSDLDIDSRFQLEIVEAGQFNNQNGRNAELAPALEPSDITLREKYNNIPYTIAFYVRLRDDVYTETSSNVIHNF